MDNQSDEPATKTDVKQIVTEALSEERKYTQQVITEALSEERKYTQQVITEALSEERKYTQQVITEALSEERKYTQQVITEALSEERKYTRQMFQDFANQITTEIKEANKERADDVDLVSGRVTELETRVEILEKAAN